MGIFSRKREYVNTSIQPLFNVEEFRDPTKTAIQRALVWGTDFSDEYQREVNKGIHTQVEAAYKYAKKGSYFYGTPDMTHFGQVRLEETLLPVLESIYGAGTSIEFFMLGELHPIFAGFDKIYNEYSYNQGTNEIPHYSTLVGKTAFLDDIIPHHEQDSRNDLRIEDTTWFGPNPRAGVTPDRPYPAPFSEVLTPPVLSSINGVEIFYTWVDGSNATQKSSELIDLSGFDGQDFIQAIVRKPDGSVAVWKYLPGLGTYPTLDALVGLSFTGTGDYFPFIPFRAGRQDLTVEARRTSDGYVTAERLMRKMNMDYQSISDQIHANPEINDIEQAIMTVAVSGDTDNQTDLEYLFKFFQKVAESPINPEHTQGLNYWGDLTPSGSSNVIRWADAGFEIRLSFYDLKMRTQVGQVADVGKYALVKSTQSATQTVKNPRYNEDREIQPEFITESWDYPVFSYCYQVNPQTFIEVKLIGAISEYPVTGEKSTFFFSDKDQFIVPVDMEIVKTMYWKTKQEFYTRNLKFVFNSKIVQKLAWYQTGLFKAFSFVVAFVALVFGLVQVSAAVIKITAATTFSAMLLTAGTYLAQLLLIKAIGMLIIQAIGPEAGLIVSMLLLAAGLAGEAGFNLPPLVDSKTLIALVSGIQEATQSVLQKAFAAYSAESQSFLEESQSKLQELEDLKKELNLDLLDSPFTDRYTAPMYLPDESPADFFYRTIHTGNVGTVQYKSIENYASNSLKLPGIDRDPRIEVQVYV